MQYSGMKLSDWFNQQDGLTATEFARRIERATSTVTRIIKEEVRPDWGTMDAISRETGGAVTPNDFQPQTTQETEAASG